MVKKSHLSDAETRFVRRNQWYIHIQEIFVNSEILFFRFPRKDSMDRRIAECIEVEELVILITFYVAAFHFL